MCGFRRVCFAGDDGGWRGSLPLGVHGGIIRLTARVRYVVARYTESPAAGRHEEDVEGVREQIEIEGRSGKFEMVDTIHTKYSNRPDILENVCLAQFASSYKTCSKPNKNFSFKNENSFVIL